MTNLDKTDAENIDEIIQVLYTVRLLLEREDRQTAMHTLDHATKYLNRLLDELDESIHDD